MLTLFSDFALLMPNESYVADLGSLLPAVAAQTLTPTSSPMLYVTAHATNTITT